MFKLVKFDVRRRVFDVCFWGYEYPEKAGKYLIGLSCDFEAWRLHLFFMRFSIPTILIKFSLIILFIYFIRNQF